MYYNGLVHISLNRLTPKEFLKKYNYLINIKRMKVVS